MCKNGRRPFPKNWHCIHTVLYKVNVTDGRILKAGLLERELLPIIRRSNEFRDLRYHSLLVTLVVLMLQTCSVKGLMQGGAIKYEERPVWFDVYRAFPPAEDPLYEKPVRTTEVRNIFYPEDAIRAKFYKTYTSGVVNLATDQGQTACDQFAREYIRLSNDPSVPKSDLHKRTRDALEQEGLFLITQEEFAAKAAEQRQLHLQKLERLQKQEQEAGSYGERSVDAEDQNDAVLKAVDKLVNINNDDGRREMTQTAKDEKSRMSLEENKNEILPSLGKKK